ncbi:MAG: transglutaminase-like domain-containing protein [Bacteroides sp.]|nr:transglutaminase-like domain-containing protein [Bacteroides sp.]
MGREQLTDWRKVYRERFDPLVRGDQQVGDAGFFRMMDTLSGCFNSQTFFFTQPVPEYPSWLLLDVKRAPCKEYVNLFTMIVRATGIPVMAEFIPQWATGPMGHDWNMVRFGEREYDFLLGENYRPGEHFNKFYLNRAAKIYRYCFGRQSDWVPFVAAPGEKLYPFFTVPNLRDVTAHYLPVVDLEVPDLFGVKPKKENLYLAVFDNVNWIPVAWGERQGEKGFFRDIAVGVVVLPVCYHKGKIIPVQYPVKIDVDGVCTLLRPDMENRQRIVLWRKFRDTRALQLAAYMEGGVFELADNGEFRNALRLPVGDSVGLNYQTLFTGTDRVFTHFRYLPKPGTPGYIAEIELYDPQGDLVRGEVTGTYVPYLLHKHIRYMEYVFDGEPLTFANSLPEQQDAWVGLVLERPTSVERIVFFCPARMIIL